MSGKPHKHAELIKAWADGAEIQVESPKYNSPMHGDINETKWDDILNPSWDLKKKYRIKPKDVVKYRNVLGCDGFDDLESAKKYAHRSVIGHVKCTFDGETGKLKSVEIAK